MIDLFLKVKTSTFLSYLSLYGPVPLSGVAPTQVEQMQLAAKMAELRTAQQRAMELPRTPLSHPLTPTNIPPPPPSLARLVHATHPMSTAFSSNFGM